MIVPGASMARLRARFREQFTPVGNGYAYRRSAKGAALPVSAVDAESFIASFDRTSRWLSWGGVLGAMAVFGTVKALDVRWPAWVGPDLFWVGAVPFMLAWGALFWTVWNAPYRVLNGRAPLAPALTGVQVRRQGLRALPWNVLVIGALASVGLSVRVMFEPDPFSAANRGYHLLAAVLLLCFGGMALAKIRAR